MQAGGISRRPLNNRRVTAVEEAIKSIEAAQDQPELRTIPPGLPKSSSKP
jgi:hypothetical protein